MARLPLLLGLGLGLCTMPVAASILPEQPAAGLRITVSVSCDFQQRWWEANLYPGSELPLEVRWRSPGMRGTQPRDLVRTLTEAQRARLYQASRAAFADFQLDRRPPLLGDPDAEPWLGPRTLTLSALILDSVLGRVDRVDLAIDLLPGRALGEPLQALLADLSRKASAIDLNLDCR